MTKLLISVGYVDEVPLVRKYGEFIDILDLKNVSCNESLGCPRYRLICYAVKNKFTKLSIPVGDVEKPCSSIITFAEFLDTLDIDFIKIGICMRDIYRITELIVNLKRSLTRTKLVVAGFGDYYMFGYIDPIDLLDICRRLDIEIFMIDTKAKDGKSIVEKYGMRNILKVRELCETHGMLFSIAGGLKISDIEIITRDVKPDIIGVRSAICRYGNSRSSIIDETRLIEVIRSVKKLSFKTFNQHHCSAI